MHKCSYMLLYNNKPIIYILRHKKTLYKTIIKKLEASVEKNYFKVLRFFKKVIAIFRSKSDLLTLQSHLKVGHQNF